MNKYLLKPSFLIPFSIVTPYLFLGNTGITFFEIIIIFGLLQYIFKYKSIPQDLLINIFSAMFILGYFIAIANGDINFNIPFKLGDFRIFYLILLCYAGYCIGYTKYESISDIGKSRILKVIVFVLAAYVGMYPFLIDEIRLITMRPFFAPATDESSFALLYSPRFPGLGINANIWAFMNLILLIFVLKSTLERKITWIYVFLILIIIIITASKTVLFLSIISIITQIIFYKGNIQRKINILLIILPIIIGFSTWLSLTDTGKLLQDQIVIAKRISYIFESTNVNRIDPVEDRKLLWAMGIERVELSPFLGISKSTVVSESYLPYFSHPHNEFIAIWMFMGIIGLLSVIILIFGLIHKNFLYKNWPFWINIYIALVFQMFFDAAFQSTRFLPLFFIIVGLNLKELYFLKNNNIKI